MCVGSAYCIFVLGTKIMIIYFLFIFIFFFLVFFVTHVSNLFRGTLPFVSSRNSKKEELS